MRRYRSQGEYALNGIPDIVLIHNGQYIGLEIKTPQGKLSPEQILFKKRLERSGGIYYVLRSVDDLYTALDELGIA